MFRLLLFYLNRCLLFVFSRRCSCRLGLVRFVRVCVCRIRLVGWIGSVFRLVVLCLCSIIIYCLMHPSTLISGSSTLCHPALSYSPLSSSLSQTATP